MENFEKDKRNQRFKRVNFKKRDNKRESYHTNIKSIARLDQSLKSIYGDKCEDLSQLNKAEKINLIKLHREVPKALKKFDRENPIILAV